MPRAGWKICVNDPRAQARLGLRAPFVGWMNGARVVASGASYATPPGARIACEPEIAIRVGRTGNPSSLDGARAAIAMLAPALEVVDYTGVPLTLDAIVTSASFHDGVVLGDRRPPTATPTLTADCPRVTRNGERVGPADPALVPADLATVVHHVAACLGRYGEELRAGDWILCGACAAPIRVAPGDRSEEHTSELQSPS